MSIPPNVPSGGYYGVPPQNNNGSGGCLKAAGITCGVLFLLMICLGFWGFMVFQKQSKDPHSVFGVIVSAGKAAQSGIQIQRAIVQYHARTGQYPDYLSDLVPKDLPDGKILHSDLDPNSDPGHVSWQYIKPEEGADPKTPILKLPYDMTMNAGGQTSTQHTVITFNLDGTTTNNVSQSTGPGAGSTPPAQ